MVLLWQKVALFALPLVLITGGAVAYHDGVLADDVQSAGSGDVGNEVTVKGTVIAVERDCSDLDERAGKNVECFVLREAGNDESFILVTTDHAAPALDEVVVARGILRFHSATESQSGSTSWPQTCWSGDGKHYEGGCAKGGTAGWSWGGFQISWVDAADVDAAWVFR